MKMHTPNIKKLYFKDTSFASLMKHRIYNVLLYASKYDAFMLEEDGRIDEQIFNEYTALNLRYPPRFTWVSSEAEADRELSSGIYDLIIAMPSGETVNPFSWAKEVKVNNPGLPFVVLTPFSRSVSERMSYEDLSAIDYVYSWLGNSDILLAITKILEDAMNVDEDNRSVGVQTILYVEDSVRYYSSVLPHLYKCVFKQSLSFMTEALNDHEQMLRMRGRPKILFARNFEEATEIYQIHKEHMLGVISDVSFNKAGEKDKQAGIELCKLIRQYDKHIPIILQSSEIANEKFAKSLKARFVNKNSSSLLSILRDSINSDFGFSDFIFINPTTGEEESRAKNLRALQENIFSISDECLLYHVKRNDFSRWLYSRAMFPLAEFLKNFIIEQAEPGETQEIRNLIFEAIVDYRKIKNQGVVAVFLKDRFDQYSNFARIGEGSMGGKGRGLAFIDAMIKSNPSLEIFPDTQIRIPKTVVVCTDLFSEFMEENDLTSFALSDEDDEEILARFLKAHLPKRLVSDLYSFLGAIHSPIAVRSSSLLEDSHYQPFAGVYSTYMVPFDENSTTNTLSMLSEAIKAVYASVYYRSSKAYMNATKNVIDEEKMAVVLQEVCGQKYGERFYPSFSGVARSINYYPIGSEKAEDGIANIAMGLGKYIVDGGTTLRFSPAYPNHILQLSSMDFALRETQTHFNALDLSKKHFVPQVDDGFNLLKINVQDAYPDGTLKYIASTYNFHDMVIEDTVYPTGRKLITFANILQHNVFPLADVLKTILKTASGEMGKPIEIEFSVNLDYKTGQNQFYFLQIRPIVESKEMTHEDLNLIPVEDTLLKSEHVLGHGSTRDVQDIIYVKTEAFSQSNNQLIAYELEKVNRTMMNEGRYYVLIGPGRWGSSDHWLGIPVKWPHICNALVIVESGLSNYRIEPSQGTHFFQNLVSLGVSYFTINPFINDGYWNIDLLNEMPAVYESKYIRQVRFDKPLSIKADARKNIGIIMQSDE